MTNEDLRKTVESARKLTAELTTSKEKALAFLVECGINKPDGELTDNYKPRA